MIGIFDSGVGGMTVARAVEKLLPSCPQIYFGDLARTPYGSKSPETIFRYSVQNMEFLLSRGAKLVIIACNSAASVASDELRKLFDVPIFEVISPAVRRAVTATGNGRIGVIGTRATIKSGAYDKEIAGQALEKRVFSEACPLLVPLVEEGWLDKRETKMILRRYLYPLKLKQVDTLILGCTHYPLLKKFIQPRIGTRVTIIDSSEEVACALKKYLDTDRQLKDLLFSEGENQYYVSDVTDTAKLIAQRIFGRKIEFLSV
ncbi:MAG: glutamate racemase [Thermodesulfobacteriota bacterium]|nr:glutamate racemase [Thermodesulfobacteriota bacterium]